MKHMEEVRSEQPECYGGLKGPQGGATDGAAAENVLAVIFTSVMRPAHASDITEGRGEGEATAGCHTQPGGQLRSS
ncbi:hypothetical protein AAFF_G00296290 [Aldrovandia affinis]|uniref:Uncharacterized protein n=1 Tax=Aldrovandia affinis TaxID=143900 RepID=A0AAD7SR29_9TELE|nr:hypothetical protein AAFF_G00296290 [Aldrovandia affinis]